MMGRELNELYQTVIAMARLDFASNQSVPLRYFFRL